MKKLLLIAAAMLVLCIAGVAVAASSASNQTLVDPTVDNRLLESIKWSGTAWGRLGSDGPWRRFEIYYNENSEYDFWGTWWGTDNKSGLIIGEALAISTTGKIYAEGTFSGDYFGEWTGNFDRVGDTCYGTCDAYTFPPGYGAFGGNLAP